jgi:uncharacterized protein YcbK (DUF882 family)
LLKCCWRVVSSYFILIVLILSSTPASIASETFSTGKADFSVRCNDQILRYETQGIFVMPGENVVFEILDADWEGTYRFKSKDKKAQVLSDRKWCWQAPKRKGVYTAEISYQPTHAKMEINIFVMVPFQQVRSGRLQGFKLGYYPKQKKVGNTIYKRPKGFIEVTPENINTWISPHFQLKQFLCKQTKRFPQYVVVDRKLVNKMECILEKLNTRGVSCQTLSIMSGFRTPYYNKRLGNVKYSSHVWGRAADIFVDENHDGVMDDINKDGKRNYRDLKMIYHIVNELDSAPKEKKMAGGMGLYSGTRYHGPFVHVDVRGKRARWGIAFKKPSLAKNKR